jgi:hypothetical protein
VLFYAILGVIVAIAAIWIYVMRNVRHGGEPSSEGELVSFDVDSDD